MRRPALSRSPLWLAGGLAVALAALAALQWRWIGRWSAVEAERMEAALQTAAAGLDRDFNGRLGAVSDAFAGPFAFDAGDADTLAARLGQWRARAETPTLVREVWWVTPGPTPRIARLDGGALRPGPWPERLGAWREAVAALPSGLGPGPTRFVLDRGALPATPPAVLVPALSPAPRFVIVELDAAALADSVLRPLAARHLGDGLYDARVASWTDPGAVLFETAPGATFATPDLAVGVGPRGLMEYVVESRPLSVEVTEAEHAGPGADPARWQLLVQHRAGSIAAATAGLRRRQLALAFGVLAVLAAAVALLVASARRQRALAQRQVEFVAGVTHELRTPLAVLRTAGENLADGLVTAPEAAREYGALVRDESTRLADMVEAALAYAGADTAPRRARVPVEAVVEDAVARARPLLDEAGAALLLEVPPGLPALDADAEAVATAVRNLLGNAARHGGPTVRLGARAATHGGAPAVEIAVSDDGPGVPEADRPDLFEPFVRGRAAVEAQTPGSGLGLALVRRVAETHGGAVALRDGSTFALTLPAAP